MSNFTRRTLKIEITLDVPFGLANNISGRRIQNVITRIQSAVQDVVLAKFPWAQTMQVEATWAYVGVEHSQMVRLPKSRQPASSTATGNAMKSLTATLAQITAPTTDRFGYTAEQRQALHLKYDGKVNEYGEPMYTDELGLYGKDWIYEDDADDQKAAQ